MKALAPEALPQLTEEEQSPEDAALAKILAGSRSGPAYVEEGSTILQVGVLDYTIPWTSEKVTADLRFNRDYVEDPNDPPQDIRAVIMEVTRLHVKIRLSGAPIHDNLIWRWQVVAPGALVDPNPDPRGPQFILNSITLASAERTIEDKLRESISLLDFGGVGDGTTNNDAAILAAIDSPYPVIYVPAGQYQMTLGEADLAGKRLTGPGRFLGLGDSLPYYQGSANFTRIDDRSHTRNGITMNGDFSLVDARKFILEGDSRHNLDESYYEATTTPRYIEANFRSGGSGYLSRITAPALAGATVITLFNLGDLKVGDDLAFGIGNSYVDRHSVTDIDVGTKQVTLGTPLTLTHYVGALTVAADAGDTVLTLSTVVGISAGDRLIFHPSGTDIHTVLSVNTGANQVTLGSYGGGPVGLAADYDIGAIFVNQNQATVLNAVRTHNQIWLGVMNHVSGGDAFVYEAKAYAWHGIPDGVDDFQKNSTIGIIGGNLEAEAEGVFMTAYEFQHNDNGHDISAAGGGMTFNRSKGRFPDLISGIPDTHGAYGNTWIGHYVANGGYQPLDCAYRIAGYMYVGFDFVPGIYANGCALGLATGNKIFFNNSAGGTRTVLVGDVQGDVTMGHNQSRDALDFFHTGNRSLSVVEDGIQIGTLATIKKFFSGSGVNNFGTIAPGATSSYTIPIPGVVIGDTAMFSPDFNADPGFTWKWLAVTDGVLVVAKNNTAGSLAATSATYTAFVIRT